MLNFNPNGVAKNLLYVYVADTENHTIRKIDQSGVVSTLAGNGERGFADGTKAKFADPFGIVAYGTSVYITDAGNNRIRKIDSSGIVSTVAGSGVAGFADGPGLLAKFSSLSGITVDSQQNLYVTDKHRIRKITPSGIVSTIAGGSQPGYRNGVGTAAKFNMPKGIDIDPEGNLYVADTNNHRIRKIDPSGNVTKVAGNGEIGNLDGNSNSSQFNFPGGITFYGKTLYVSDTENCRIRVIYFE